MQFYSFGFAFITDYVKYDKLVNKNISIYNIIFELLLQNERKPIAFYLPKAILVGPFWICGVIMAKYRRMNEFDDPAFSYEIDSSAYTVKTIK